MNISSPNQDIPHTFSSPTTQTVMTTQGPIYVRHQDVVETSPANPTARVVSQRLIRVPQDVPTQGIPAIKPVSRAVPPAY